MKIVALAAIISLCFGCAPTSPLPKGWRYPGEADYLGGWKEHRKEIPKPFYLRADFNGDGIVDEAWILLPKAGQGYYLVALLGQREGSPKLVPISEPQTKAGQDYGIALVRPGKYATACGKGYFDCDQGEAEAVELKLPGIEFSYFESASFIYYWDQAAGTFKGVQTSD